MRGMNAATGRPLAGTAHIWQSVCDILTTPLGTRVMRRGYGSRIPELIDAPLTDATLIEIYSATAEALAKWEPRFRLKQVRAESANAQGRLALRLDGEHLDDNGKAVRMEGVVIV